MDAPGGEEVAIADQQDHLQDGNKAELDQEVDSQNSADRQAAVREFVDFTEYLPSDISRTLSILHKMDLAYESHKSELERAAITMSGAVPIDAITNGPAIPIVQSTTTEQPEQAEQPEQPDTNLAAPASESLPPAITSAPELPTDPNTEVDTQPTNGTSSAPPITTVATIPPTTTHASLFGPPGKILLPNNEYMRMRLGMSQEVNRALKAREQALAEAEKMGLMVDRHRARAQHIYEKMKQIPVPNQSTGPITPKGKGTPKDKAKSGRILLRTTDSGRRTTEKAPRAYKKNREGAPKTERRRKIDDGSDAGEGSSRKKVGRTHQREQRLSLLPPLTSDGKPIPPEDMPWNKLLPHELARLRKRMKKNTTWTPSTTMILKELEGLGRGPLNKEKFRHQWEGKDDVFIPAEDGGIGKLAYGTGGAGVGENKGMKLNAAKRKLKEQKAIEGGLSLERPEKKPRKREPTIRAAPAIIPIPTDFSRPDKPEKSTAATTEQSEPKEKLKKPEMVQRMTTVEVPSPSKRKEKRQRDPKAAKEPRKPKPAETGKEVAKESDKGKEIEKGIEKDVVVPNDKDSKSQHKDTTSEKKTTEEQVSIAEPTQTKDDDMGRNDTHEVDADGDVDIDAEGEPEGDDADADAEAEPDVDVDMDAEGEKDTGLTKETAEKPVEKPTVKESTGQNGVKADKEEGATGKPGKEGETPTDEKHETPTATEETPTPLKCESDFEAEKASEPTESVAEGTVVSEATDKPLETETKKETPAPSTVAPVAPVTKKAHRKKSQSQVDVPPPPHPIAAEAAPGTTSAVLSELDKAADNISKESTEAIEKNGTSEGAADAEETSKADKPKRAPAKRAKKLPKKNVAPLPPILPDSHILQAAPPPTPTLGRNRKSPKKIDVPPPPLPPNGHSAPASSAMPIAIPLPTSSAPPLPTKAPRKERKSSSATPAPHPHPTTSSTTLPPIHIPHPSTLTATPTSTSTPIPHIPIPLPQKAPTPQPTQAARTTRGSGRPQTATPAPSIQPPPSPVAANGRGTKRKRLSISHPVETTASPTEAKRPTKPPPKRRKKGTKKGAAVAATDADAAIEAIENAGGVGIEEPEEEPVYCLCRQVSKGTMVMCDNPKCEKEWFHLGCVGLKQAPSSKRKWYCPDCIATGIDKELEGIDNHTAVGVDALPVGKKI